MPGMHPIAALRHLVVSACRWPTEGYSSLYAYELRVLNRFRARLRGLLCASAIALTSIGAAPQHDGYAATFEALRAADTRLQRIGERLAIANARFCRALQPAIGLALHSPDQYLGDANAAAVAHFGFASAIGVAGVVPGSAGQRAGIQPGDSIVRINGRSVDQLVALPSDTRATSRLAALHRFLADRPAGTPIDLMVRRAGRDVAARLAPRPACRARFEQTDSQDVDASADGTLVQISSRLLGELEDEGVAVLLAHELAHNALEHRRRLDEAGVRRGILSGFGRSVGLFRQTEVEADILAVHLLAGAGYDPAIAPRFWRGFGARYAGGIRSRTHPAWRDRVATMEAELPRVAAGAVPGPVETRDRPLDGNWQALLIRAR